MASKPLRSEPLLAWLPQQRWFGAKSRRIQGVQFDDSLPVAHAALHILRVTLDDGDVQRYAVPLSAGDEPADALDDPAVTRALVALARDGGRVDGRHAALAGYRTRAFPAALDPAAPVRKVGGEQSNTSLVIGETLIVKCFRRLSAGVNPDLEITRYLTDEAAFPHTPALAGWLTYGEGEATATLAVIQHLVRGAGDGWQWMLGALREDARRARTLPALARLGEATAALHVALAGAPASAPDLAPEPIGEADVARWTQDVAAQLATARASAPRAADVPAIAPEQVSRALSALRGRVKCRHHGDFHFGQTLYAEDTGAWTLIDFEGEPLRPLAERRRKHSPLRDVAGMLRSIAYAAETVRAGGAAGWIDGWERDARRAFVDGYLATAGRAPFLPEDAARTAAVIAAFELEKAAYEVVYEANNRPDWVKIPLAGLLRASSAVAA
ncbi:MAG: sugar phosphotransferase [Candidatus Rokubacteria bacterium]|nr:sugar phosphotransferase [Candidatus Rokubacteria bacterium]